MGGGGGGRLGYRIEGTIGKCTLSTLSTSIMIQIYRIAHM